MAHILVIGGSRGIGQAVCQASISNGHRVRAMSRNGKQPVDPENACKVVQGDARDGDAVAKALDGVDIVVQALGVPPSLDLLTKPVTLFSQSTQTLLSEMEKVGPRKLISVTGFGAGTSVSSIHPLQRLPFRCLLGRAYDDKSVQERMIEKSEFDWLIVRPGVLTQGPATGKYRVLRKPGEWRNGIVSRADVADFIVSQIDNETLGREKPVIIQWCL